MHAQFTVYPLWNQWFKGFVGNFGLLDYGFPLWVYYLFLAVFVALGVLAVKALISARAARQAALAEIVSYAAIALGLLIALARVGYPYHLAEEFFFEQARYLFPLLALYGLFFARLCAERAAAGARRSPGCSSWDVSPTRFSPNW